MYFLTQITGAITSYLIILIQFNLAAAHTKKGAGNGTSINATLNESMINLTTMLPLLNDTTKES